ncbi:hypothetical protein D3C85_927400 [compost metagenome]
MRFHLVAEDGTTEHGGTAAIILTIEKDRVPQGRGVVHQVTVRIEQSCTAIDAQQHMQPDVIQQAGQVVTHGAGKTGRFLRGLLGLLNGGALAQLFTRFVQSADGLLQAGGDAAQDDSGTGIDVIERRIKGLQVAF